MSLTITDNFRRDGYTLISCHNPLVLIVELSNVTLVQQSGDVTVSIQGQGDDVNIYTFGMGLVSSAGSAPTLHTFRLDITDIIRKICNEPDLDDQTGANDYALAHRLATTIEVTVSSSGETDASFTNQYMHGFNQVHDPDSSCLVDMADQIARIPIVPGAPMAHFVWAESSAPSFNINYRRDTSVLHTIVVAAALSADSLVQAVQTALDAAILSNYANKIEVMNLQLLYSTTTIGLIELVTLTEACENSVLLAWLNKYGTYSYMAFERFPIIRGEQKHIGEFDIQIDDLADVKSRTKSRGYENARDVITAVAKNIPIEYFDIIDDLFTSMDVYYFTGTLPEDTFSEDDWLRVRVRGNLSKRQKYGTENVRVDVLLPEKYTQLR